MRASSRKLVAKFLSTFLFTLAILLSGLGFVPTAFAVAAATVTVPATVQVQANSATTNVTGISISGLSGTILVAVGLSNFPANAVLKLPTTTGLTASYGFTSGSNTFASFTNISFTGAIADVNTALAAMQYLSGATGSSNPTVKVTATTSDSGVALNGYNGHFYKSSAPTTAYYTTAGSGARAAAKASTYKGQSGYVVTITSDAENTFVSTAIESAASIWIGATDELVEGVWRWDTSGGSPEAGTIFWNGASGGSSPSGQWAKWSSGEPNDYGGAEDYAVTNWNGGIAWNDCGDNACGSGAKYVIEYGTNAADGGFINASSDLGSGTFTLSYTPTLTGTTANLNVTFGTAGYDTVTATNGTGTKTFTRTSSPGNAGITLNTSVTNQAVLTVASSVPGGTYYETLTATDAASVTATFLITVTVSYPPSSDTDSAMVFNGSTQYATASGDVSGFDIADAISIEAWIYPTSANCHGNIVVKAFSYYLYCDTGILYYAMASTNTVSGVSTGITIPVNQWSHVAVTRAASTPVANVYVNGILQYSGTASSAGSSPLYNSSNLFNIGARDAGANFFTGQIDEVKLWNVARSASDVLSDLKTYGGTLASGLVAYYDFNDLYGNYLVNRSTSGSGTLNLTVVNSPTLSASAISTTTTSAPYSITTFTRNYLVASGGWKSPELAKKIKYLIVAGGGGGGAGYEGGGGGAGGYLESTTSISANTYYPIVVGVGGRGGLKIYGPTNGESSTAFSITAFGGGRGGTEQSGMSGPNAERQSGGSGGGGSHGSYTDVTGASGTTGQGSSGGAGLSNGAQFVGGGGGGASAVGGAATISAPGNGGAGKTATITGTSLNLAGGGGGSGRSNTVSRVGTASFGGGAGGLELGVSGTTNTGGGGGAATSVAVYGTSTGGSGGSGLIVLRYLTSNPSINLQPTNDTTTAGLTDSFTVGTTTVSSPYTKTVIWQVATDTVTAVASVLWTNVSTGIGFTTETFTTSTLTFAMNKYRYRAIVTFSDSDSLTAVETSTVATLTVNPAISITSTQTAISTKYGSSGTTRTITYTGGTDTRTVSASFLSLASGKITFDTSTALFTVDTRTAVGTYLDTITITDAKGATASYVQTITYTVADTLTVTSDTPTALTYTGSTAVFTPSLTTVTGLIAGDVISDATYSYSATALSCANGGPCSIGQTGPGGGLIFITPSTSGNTTGKYFEAAPAGWNGSGTDPLGKYCVIPSLHSGALGTAIGTGQANTIAVAADCVSIADTATALVLNGKNDWFIPSLDELKEMYTSLYKASPTSLGGFTGVDYWSSSDHATNAGYALRGWFGSSDGISGWGFTDETGNYSYRPVRSFIATSTSTVNYGPSTTKPTGAGTYVITPSVRTFSSGDANNYVAITYRTSTLTINKAAQATLVVTPLYNVFNGNPTSSTLYTTGGTDTGTVTYTYVSSLSTASGCALSGVNSSIVTVTSAGTCRVVATKAATDNYLIAVSETATVTFYQYVTNFPVPRAAAYPTEIVLGGTTPWTSNGLAPTITTTGIDFTAKSPTGVFTISGTGFIGTRLVRVSGVNAAFTVLSDTSLQITMPAGLVGISGPIYVEKSSANTAGFVSETSDDWVTGTA